MFDELPRWTPCLSDPVKFDCANCEIGPTAPCRYRTDDSLRHARAARHARFAGVAAPELDINESEVIESAVAIGFRQTLSMPARLILTLIPLTIRAALDEHSLASILRRSMRFQETSPGMFRPRPESDGLHQTYHLPVDDLTIGAAIDVTLAGYPPLGGEFQRVRLKRLSALMCLCAFTSAHEATSTLTTRIDELAPNVLAEERWSFRDAVGYAFSDLSPPITSKPDDASTFHRRGLLSAIHAVALARSVNFARLETLITEERDFLLVHNSALVAKFARQYAAGGFMQYADLFQTGFVGLMRALRSFDPFFGTEFSTYATWWVKQAISRSIANEERLIRIPGHVVDKLNTLARVSRNLVNEQYFGPSAQDIGREMGLATEEIEELLPMMEHPISLDAMLADPSARKVLDSVEDLNAVDPFETASRQNLGDMIRSVMTTLPARESKVLRLRFGLQDGRSHTLEEIGQKFGLTRERIRQIEAKALKRLRHRTRAKRLRDFWDLSGRPPSDDLHMDFSRDGQLALEKSEHFALEGA